LLPAPAPTPNSEEEDKEEEEEEQRVTALSWPGCASPCCLHLQPIAHLQEEEQRVTAPQQTQKKSRGRLRRSKCRRRRAEDDCALLAWLCFTLLPAPAPTPNSEEEEEEKEQMVTAS